MSDRGSNNLSRRRPKLRGIADYPDRFESWPTPASGSTPSSPTTTTSTAIRASAGTRPPACTFATAEEARDQRAVSLAEVYATPNASPAAPDHPRYPTRHGSTTRPSAGKPHHKPHSITTVSLDLKSSARSRGSSTRLDAHLTERPEEPVAA